MEISSIGFYMRSISEITPKWNDIRTGSDINELYEIVTDKCICQ